MSELPLVCSPRIKAQLMGALPRLRGRSEACAPIMPTRAVRRVSGARIWLQPMTNTTSSARFLSSSRDAASLMCTISCSGTPKRWHSDR